MKKKDSYGARLVASLQEAVAIERGVTEAPNVTRHLVSARVVMATPARRFDADGVKLIRKKIGLSQAVFSAALNVSAETVRAWEQGKKQPSGPAERLLEIADTNPDVIQSVIHRRDKSDRSAAK